MLPAHTLELLTAAVDGELSVAERRLVDKLLRESEEARRFHTQLQASADRLRRLPIMSPSDDLAASVMNMIADRSMMPTPLPSPRRQPAWNVQKYLPWVSLATAASAVIAVGVFSYLYFMASERHLVNLPSDRIDAPAALPPKVVAKQDARPNEPTPAPAVEVVGTALQWLLEPIAVAIATAPAEAEILPGPRVVPPDFFVAPPFEPEQFRVVPLKRLPLVLPLHDLAQAYPKQRLREELKQDEVVRIDLFCKDGVRATEIVQNVLKARGQQVLVDAAVQDRIRKKQKGGDIVVYTESLSAEEIAQLLEQLGGDDKKHEAKKSGDGQFEMFMLAPFLAADLSELAKLLNIPPAQLKLPKPKSPTVIDPRKSLESITAAQLMASLPKAASRGSDKTTLVLPYGVSTFVPANSKEAKSFLDKRGERKQGTVPMMLVLRTIN